MRASSSQTTLYLEYRLSVKRHTRLPQSAGQIDYLRALFKDLYPGLVGGGSAEFSSICCPQRHASLIMRTYKIDTFYTFHSPLYEYTNKLQIQSQIHSPFYHFRRYCYCSSSSLPCPFLSNPHLLH